MAETLSFYWFIFYETAVVRAGRTATEREAQLAAIRMHDALVIAGLDPDRLAYAVR